ncbi:nitrate regulatory gene2 protein-like [Tasmannia lanceolata]|uniref:nitrate regulatory gene2 protein-like n=1 Tax=Tasmannia lanceolata TaxID=3420 RepID=UPI004062A5CC
MGGCSGSNLDNEDPVRRCKDRLRLMKQAVYSRSHLASALFSYLYSLFFVGFALYYPPIQSHSSPSRYPTTLPTHILSTSIENQSGKYPHLPANSKDFGSTSSSARNWQEYPLPSAPPYEGSSYQSSPKSEARSNISLAETSETGTPTAGEISDRMIRYLTEIKDYFIKVAEAGGPVSDLLETRRAQFNQKFPQMEKNVHCSNLLSNLFWRWTWKPPLAVKYRLDMGEASGKGKSHYSTLETLLAWENKLYDEVKAREKVKIKHQKKLSALQNQEYWGVEDAKLDETNASIKSFQSLLIVTSQAVSTTSSAIDKVRDDELSPQLVELCHGVTHMWRSMNQLHNAQNHIVQQAGGFLVNRSISKPELHSLKSTRRLILAVSSWHSSFSELIKYLGYYVQSLHNWLKLTLIPSGEEEEEEKLSPSCLVELIEAYNRVLPYATTASQAIKRFVQVIHGISKKQAEEIKTKKNVKAGLRELEKKSKEIIRNIDKKLYHSNSRPRILGFRNGGRADAQDPLANKKKELREHLRQVEEDTRAEIFNDLHTGLLRVFQAMTEFSGAFANGS